MEREKQPFVSLRGAMAILLCACALFAVAADAPSLRETAAAPAALTVRELLARREALRQEETLKRKQEEARKWAAARQQGVVFLKTIKKSGELDKRIDVVIFADGFQRAELGKFSGDASRVAVQLLRTYPYSDYSNFFNFHIVGVESKDSGVSTEGRPRETAFGSALLARNALVADIARLQPYAELPPDMDLGIVLANTIMPKARSTAMGPFVTLRLGGSLGRTVAHELGHAFGQLGDEYVEFKGTDPKRAEPPQVNITAESDPRKAKWRYWIEAGGGAVGLLEGANYYEKGYYRPERECLMRSGNQFCRVCLEQMIRRIYESVPPIDAAYPLKYIVEIPKGESRKFAVRVNAAQSAPVVAEWYVDGALDRKGATEFSFNTTHFAPGEHELLVKATCVNRNVLRDQGFLESSMFWKVNILPYSMPALDVTSQPLGAKVGEEFTYQVKGRAGDRDRTLTYKTTLAPDGLVIDAMSGEIKWTPGQDQVGAHLARIAADDGSHSVSAELLVKVCQTDAPLNRQPVIDFIPVREATEGELIEFTVKAQDLDGHHVVYRLANAPDGATFDGDTGEFRWRPDFSQVGEYELEFKAWDGLAYDRCKVPVMVRDVLFGAADMAAVEREMSRGNKDAFFGVFYALRCKDTSVRRRGITMLKSEGAKSAAAELARLLRDREESVAGAAADALLGLVKEKFNKGDSDYFALLLNELADSCGQLKAQKDRLEKLKEILAAVNDKSENKKIKSAAETIKARLGG